VSHGSRADAQGKVAAPLGTAGVSRPVRETLRNTIGRCFQGDGFAPNSYVLQRFSCVERVTGIEPALSAWEPT
jgi:hypothetical protein